MKSSVSLPLWTILAPLLAWLLFGGRSFTDSWIYSLLLVAGMIGAVLAAVHHAEVVAHKVGEPFGTLVLALAVTIIEASLVISLMLAGGSHASSTLARDTVFAAIMIILTGIVGISLLLGASKFREQVFELQGSNTALSALISIAVITLILPNYTTTTPGPAYTDKQLLFVAIATLVIYGSFVLVQTIRHREYFLAPGSAKEGEDLPHRPSKRTALLSLGFLLISLVVVVLMAESLAPGIEHWIDAMKAPKSLVGIMISATVLLPEGISAVRAAMTNRIQTSLNLAFGSALATIGLTIPLVSIASILAGWHLDLGIDSKSTVMLLLATILVMLSLRTGKTNILPGIILLIIFAAYLFLTIFP
jgi:Ca2+:H+ antiporter